MMRRDHQGYEQSSRWCAATLRGKGREKGKKVQEEEYEYGGYEPFGEGENGKNSPIDA